MRRLEHNNIELSMDVCLRQYLTGRPVESLSKEEAEDLLNLMDKKAKALQVRMHQLGQLMLSPVVEAWK